MMKKFFIAVLLVSGTVFCVDETGDVAKLERKEFLQENALVFLETGLAVGLVTSVASLLKEKKINLGLVGISAVSSALFAAASYSIKKGLLKHPFEKAKNDAEIAGVILGGLALRVHYS
jgi:hypothetical protein